MIASEAAEIDQMIAEIMYNDLGGRGTVDQIHQLLTVKIIEGSQITGPNAHLVAYSSSDGLRKRAGAWLRGKGVDRLSRAPEVNKKHEHALVELITLDEFKFVIRKQMDNGDASYGKAAKWVDKAEEVYGVRIDIDALMGAQEVA